jgi:hypothetical protein
MADWAIMVIAIVAITTFGRIYAAKNGLRIGKRWQKYEPAADDRRVELLTTENDRLKGQLSRLEDRLAVLERIATDPANRVAREIDALR